MKMKMESEVEESEHVCGPLGRLRLGGTRPSLSRSDLNQLQLQRQRPVPENRAAKLEVETLRHWDIFYKRNQTNFFKDRNWTVREFHELLPTERSEPKKVLLEAGCGVGNLIFPLIKDGYNQYFFYACDFSPRAVDFVKANPLYDEAAMKAFQADLTTDDVFAHIQVGTVDVVTMIFVLSAIHPDKFSICLRNLYRLLKPGGLLLFRDYGLYDMAQLRFKPGHLISENFYVRQDGTRSYFFEVEELSKLFTTVGFQVVCNDYVERRTINKKEQIDVPRNFVQGKFRKPSS
ncbi:tRNA N(3)-cytidine methyltransferase METTL6 [Arctopsyche grandis]|uniref:tRNA N(3)-cytidine methyltransferase METTL6 n=1 Tax=Arctopsyche grandis TaxID=121162 RepID=UPI00406D93E7